MSRNSALTRFELRVNYPRDLVPALSRLRGTLSTISSPAFSELTLRFVGYPIEPLFLRPLPGEVLWGDNWGIIDGKLNDMVHAIRRDIQLVVQIGAGGRVWAPRLRAIVRAAFPLMDARGSVIVDVEKSLNQERAIQFGR